MKIKVTPATEFQEAIWLMEWASYSPLYKKLLIHIPNEGKRSVIAGHNLKRQGLKKGVSDYFFAYPCNGKSGLWIELKRRKLGKVTAEQSQHLQDMIDVGYAACVAYGWEEARDIILDYLKKPIK